MNPKTVSGSDTSRDLVTFYLGDMLCGIDIGQVLSINKVSSLTSPHCAADYIKGLMNLRGRIVTVLDLNFKFGFAVSELLPQSLVIIVSRGEDLVGILVDQICDAVTVQGDSFENTPLNMSEEQGRNFQGICKVDADLIAVMDLEEALRPVEENQQVREIL